MKSVQEFRFRLTCCHCYSVISSAVYLQLLRYT
ncbi:hypothetical protein CsSME_00025950 [Camellia sinensis var. sinensis]